MGFGALLKFLLPLIMDGLKEVTIPKRPDEKSRTSVAARIMILVIVLLLSLLAFVTDKLYVVHTDKINAEAQVTILKDTVEKCNVSLAKLDTTIAKDCSTKIIAPKITNKSTEVKVNIPKPPAPKVVKQFNDRDKMIYEINEF